MERYQLPAYRHWLNKNRDRILKENVLWAFLAAALSLYLPVLLSMFLWPRKAPIVKLLLPSIIPIALPPISVALMPLEQRSSSKS
jgi:hypothetical protein